MSDLALILALLRDDPGLGGLVMRARAGPARETAVALIDRVLGPGPRLHPAMGTDALDGGLDLAGTLAAGALHRTRGLLSRPGALRLPMSERATPWLAARLAAHLDGDRGPLVALDEGIEDEATPPAIAARCAFHVTLDDRAADHPDPPESMFNPAGVDVPDAIVDRIVTLAETIGVDDMRGPLLALRAARGIAALRGADRVGMDDATRAAELVLAPRATRLPPEAEETTEPDPPPETEDTPEASEGDGDGPPPLPEDILLDAVRAALPPDLLARLATGAVRRAQGAGSGARRQGSRRGRPLPARGPAGGQDRIDLIATLRAAAPWQTLRKRNAPDRAGPVLRKADLRGKRFEERSERLLIFCVDASGSAALARLAEAKGAVEILLAEAYARRDHVALVAFRGTEAELLLPPTRSLVRTKRRLAGLPGGGGTPLAHGLVEAHGVAAMARRKGLTPTLILLTDGRGNVALDGTRDRVRAASDAREAARAMRGMDAIVIDTGARPTPALHDLAGDLGASYLPLPRADARRLSQALGAMLGG